MPNVNIVSYFASYVCSGGFIFNLVKKTAWTLTLEELPQAKQDWVLSGSNLLLHAVDMPDLQAGLQPSRLHTIPS